MSDTLDDCPPLAGLDIRPDAALVREAAQMCRDACYTPTAAFALTGDLLDAVAEEMDFAAMLAAESHCDAIDDYRPSWSAAVDLAKKVLGR